MGSMALLRTSNRFLHIFSFVFNLLLFELICI